MVHPPDQVKKITLFILSKGDLLISWLERKFYSDEFSILTYKHKK